MLLEVHCHTNRYSKCSYIDPVTLVQKTIKKGIQGVIITEHHYLWTGDEIEQLRRDSEVDKHFLILAAQEVQTDLGHVLVFGAPHTIESETPIQTLHERYPDAALVLAHPWRKGVIPNQSILMHPLIDAVEIFSSNHSSMENYRGLMGWHEFKFVALSGSDAHGDENIGILPTQFDHPIEIIDDVAQEIKNRNCRPYFKESIKSGHNTFVTKITLGTKGLDETRWRFILRKAASDNAWEKNKEDAGINKLLYENGFKSGPFRVPGIIHIDEAEKLIIERGQRGKLFFNLLPMVERHVANVYFKLAAQWPAYLHTKKLRLGTSVKTIEKELYRFVSYQKNFDDTNSPFRKDAKRLIDTIKEYEMDMSVKRENEFVLCHGDFQPHNILIGQDISHDPTTSFISAIDFGSSFEFLPTFDVGCFLSHFHYQFRMFPSLLKRYTDNEYISKYTEQAQIEDTPALRSEITAFRIRANLSIASFLILVGKGESPDMEQIIGESLQLLEP